MSDLLRSLSTVTRSLDAQQFGLQVTGQNIANVNTAGYARRQVDFASVAPTGPLDAGGGVRIAGVRAARDRFIDRRLFTELPAGFREAATAQALGVVEVALGDPGRSIDAAMTRFFDAWSALASSPTSAVARQEVVREGQALAAGFRDMSARLASAQRDADRAIVGAVAEANTLVEQIARINAGLSGVSGAEGLHLVDQQTEAVTSLARLVDIDVLARPDGGYDITFGNGRPLVVGETAFPIGTSPAPPAGLVDLQSRDTVVTGELSGGTIAGLLDVRDRLVPDYLSRLDTLAFEVATRVNTAHASGLDLAGVPGEPVFTGVAIRDGAASAIAFSQSIAADPSRVAAGSGASGSNETARAIADLRDARVLDGGTSTFTDAWGQLVYRAGRDVETARQNQASHEGIVRQLEALRDSVSGISLDEEAMAMLKFQRAYEANARFFRAIDESIDTLLQTLSR